MVVARGSKEGGNEELLFNGNGVSGLQDEEFWRWTVEMVAQQCKCI